MEQCESHGTHNIHSPAEPVAQQSWIAELKLEGKDL